MKNNNSKENERRLMIRYFKSQEEIISEAEIEKKWSALMHQIGKEKKSFHRKTVLFSVKTACAAALITGLLWFFYPTSPEVSTQIENIIARLDHHPVDTSRQITLIIDSQETIELEKGSVVDYSQNDGVSVNEKIITKNTNKTIEYNQLIVPKGKYSRLVLADGTSLYVNAGTIVVYPNQFEKDKREIYVNGEIFIEVTPDKERPFVVRTSGFEVKVLGTSFNLNAYKNMNNAEIVLLSGSVMVTDHHRQETIMEPNEMLELKNGKTLNKRNVIAEDYMAWTLGRLPLKNRNIENILHKLSLFYGENITYDSSIKNYPLKGTIDLTVSLEKVLERMSGIGNLTYHRTDDGYYLTSK